MDYSVAYNVIRVMVVLLIILIMIRIVLVARMRFSGAYRKGHSQSIGSRDVQEDCLAVAQDSRGVIAVLADGMGKNHGGLVSSTLTVETVLDVFETGNAFQNPNYFFQKSLRQANNRILDQLDEGSGAASVAIALISNQTLYYAAVGNVQVAVFRRDELVPVTEGHTVDVLAEKKYLQGTLTRQSTIALLQERRLYSYVGQDEFRDIEIFDQPIHLRRGDIVVLMTDGVYDTIPYVELEGVLQQGHDCQRQAEAIIQKVDQEPGDKDNASVILLSV